MRYFIAVRDYLVKIIEHNTIAKVILRLPLFVFNYVYWSCEFVVLEWIFALYCIDFITWFIVAMKNRNVSSFRFLKGALKLAVYLVLIFIAIMADNLISFAPNVFLPFMYAFIIGTDSISILENLSKLWFNVPIKFVKYLEVYMHKQEKKIEDNLK